MVASTQVFRAGPELAPLPSVSRCRGTPLRVTSVVAVTAVVPVVEELRVTEQEPVPPEVVQLEGVRVPGPLTIWKLMTVPSGAFPKVVLTWPVRVWGVPTSLVAVGGEIWMLASQVLNGTMT